MAPKPSTFAIYRRADKDHPFVLVAFYEKQEGDSAVKEIAGNLQKSAEANGYKSAEHKVVKYADDEEIPDTLKK